jgi:hypothetical protein
MKISRIRASESVVVSKGQVSKKPVPLPCEVCLGKRKPRKAAVVIVITREAHLVCKKHAHAIIRKLKKALKA